MGLSIDGNAAVYGNTTQTVIATPALACANPKNVICVMVAPNVSNPVVSVTGGGVTFTNRSSSGAGNHIELWSGFSSGVFNSAITVTIASLGFTTIHAFGVNGAPSASYFDANSALPDFGTTDPGTVSTNTPDTIVLGMFRFGSTANPTAGSGYTQILGSTGSGFALSEYKIVSAPQSSLSVTAGTGAGNANGRVCDAIVLAPSFASSIAPMPFYNTIHIQE